MATGGTPVGNMIIKVDLDASGVEKSMTGLQRQLRSSNKAMGAQLSAFNRGEKSAAKYGVLIEGLSNRHRIQAQMVQVARRKYDEMVKTYGANSVKAQEAAQKLNEQIALYQETGRELDAVTAEYKEFQRLQELQSTGWYKAADSMEEWGGKLKVAGQAMDDTGRKLTRGVTMPLVALGGVATKTGSDFEAGISRVGAVSGASASEMEKLEAKARKMGATTVFSAREASDAFYYMSLAGWDASEMLDGISGVMDLAAASGEDLALVSDIVTDGLTAFGLQAKDSARMADVLAAASANANTDVAGLGQAFSYVAPVAGALGYTIEDTTKAIGLMANAGIKSTKAGTALRTMMTNLSKPTKQAKAQMDKLGISITDADGNMKSFDQVMKDLRKSFGKLSKEQQAQAASTIFGKEAMSGALAIINASEEDYQALTKAINESDGAAKDMADTMQDNLQGSLKELKSMVEDLFIEMYKNLKPTLESVIESTKNLTKWFASLSPETQKNIVKFGLLAGAMGPVLQLTGKLTFGIGGLIQGAGALTKAIGMSRNVGLLGAMSGLGPLAVGGVAVAGLIAVTGAVKKLKGDSKELKEVNLNVAQSMTDQALSLQESADTFEKLSSKAKISNEELARLNDLNIRISQSANPGEIAELQRQYDNLAKKSGLSKDELKRLFEANRHIIEQSPEVETSISKQGNEFVKNTDKVNEYIQSLLELSRQELADEIIIAEENRRKILQDNKQLKLEIKELDEKSVRLREIEAMTEAERNDALLTWHTQIKQEMASNRHNQEVYNELKKEEEIILAYINEGLGSGLEKIKEQRDTLNEKVAKNEEELAKINALDEQMANIVLKQVGINEEGERGLANLDKSIAKNEEELFKLEEKLQKNGQLTEEEKERYTQLAETNLKQKEARDYLHEELGIYLDINSLAENRIQKLDEEAQKKIENIARTSEIKVEEGNIIKQMQEKNNEIDKSIHKLENEKEKQGANKKEINAQIRELENKKQVNNENIEKILRELGLWDQVKDSIDLGTQNEKAKAKAAGETAKKQKGQGTQIDKNNQKTDAGIKKERERTKEAGKSVDKRVTAKDHGTVARINKQATQPKDKRITVRDFGSILRLDQRATRSKNKRVNAKDYGTIASLDRKASSPVTKVVKFVGRGLSKLKFWAKGTPPSGHPGGHAIMGEEGTELAILPSGKAFLTANKATFYPNLPKGTHVIPHKQTKEFFKGTPHYADGTQDWERMFMKKSRESEFMKLLALSGESKSTVHLNGTGFRSNSSSEKTGEVINLLIEQNEQLRKSNELLTALLSKDLDLYKLNKKVDEGLSNLSNRRNAAWGGNT